MKKGIRGAFRKIFLIVAFFLFVTLISSNTFAEVSIPDDLINFYANEISSMTLSNNSVLLYSNDDRAIFYYLYYNPLNTTLNITVSIECLSKECPTYPALLFDYMKNDETLPYVKKAAGIFVLTNGSKLGEFDYNLVVSDVSVNYTQIAPFKLTVISSSFWTQFWHNLLSIF